MLGHVPCLDRPEFRNYRVFRIAERCSPYSAYVLPILWRGSVISIKPIGIIALDVVRRFRISKGV